MIMGDDHAEEERLAVIAKYDKGREEGAEIDDWEDPAFEIYHVTDRYGFIHDHVLPKLKSDEQKRISVENERVDKWLKMTGPKWQKFKNSEKLKQRIYKGIPDKMRPYAWKLLLDIDIIKKQQEGKYQEMLELARKYSQDVRQIDLDVNRTYRDTRMFRERYGREQRALFNVLCAYSIYNSEVGYCQGMSQVAALLLMYMEEEDAFWALSQLMTNTKYGMHGFFIAGFPKLVRFQAHHDKVLKTMIPRMKKHFEKHGVDSGLYTLKWFFQCFLDRVPFELSLRLWDIFLLEGDRVLICGAYAILKMHQKQLLSRKNMDDILGYIQCVIPVNFGIDLDKAIINYQQYSDDLRSKKLDTGGEPSDEELPKKPFGVIEIKSVTMPKSVTPTILKEISAHEVNAFNINDDPENDIPIIDKSAESSRRASLETHSPNPNSRDPIENFNNSQHSPEQPARKYLFNEEQSRNETPTIQDEHAINNETTRESPSPIVVTTSLSSHSLSPQPTSQQPTLFPGVQSSSVGQTQLAVTYTQVSKKRVPPPVSPRKSTAVKKTNENHHAASGNSAGNIPIVSNSEAVRIHVPYSGNSNFNYGKKNNSNVNVETSSNYASHQSATSTAHPVTISSSSSSTSPVVNPRNGFDLSKNDPNRIKIDVSSHSTLIQ